MFEPGPPEAPMPQSPRVTELEAELRRDPSAVERFLAESDFPLAEPPLYTVVYHGPAEAVRLRHWVQGLATSQDFRRLAGSDLWVHTLNLPDESRVEYKIEVIGRGGSKWIEDPLNPQRAQDPFGANSVVGARGYDVPEWTQQADDVPSGEVDELVVESTSLGGARHVSVYRPPGYRSTRRYPLLLVHDGSDYLEYAALRSVLDQLIHRLEIPSLVVALMHPENRMDEYTANPAHAAFVVDELLPRLRDDYALIDEPESCGLMGASLGAVAAFDIAQRHPKMFGRLLLQSGSFAFTDVGENERGPIFDDIVDMVNGYRADPTRVTEKAFVSVGVFEPLVAENRALVPVLRRAGIDVRFVETRDGHNWENWRDRLREGLSWLFPGPLWMVYE